MADKAYSLKFGPNRLWLDCVDNDNRSDVWLELQTGDLPSATRHLDKNGVPLRDEIEAFPEGLKAHRISSPAGMIHLLRENE